MRTINLLGAPEEDAMEPRLREFLDRHTPFGETDVVWGGGSISLRIVGYVTREEPPVEYVSSVRGVVLHQNDLGADEVLVIDNGLRQAEITPGGRCEPGETLEETLRRELLEETGWSIGPPRRIGFLHFHHTTPKPEGYRYPYPDFLWAICGAEAIEHHPEKIVPEEYVRGSAFRPIGDVA